MATNHQFLAVIDAMRKAEHGGVISSNRVRPLVPEWVPSRAVGRVYSQLRRQGILEHDGYELSTDEKGRNAGKLVPIYRLRKPLTLVETVDQPKRVEPPKPQPATTSHWGPCVKCQGFVIRYGPHGRPICDSCMTVAL